MEEAKRLSIHVAVRNDQTFLTELLDTLRAQTLSDFQMTVVGGEAMSDLAQDANIIWLRNFNWHGFARTHNQAIALTLSRYPQEIWDNRFIAIMHPDLLLEPRALERMAEAFARDPELMIATPKVLRAKISIGDDMESREIETTDQIEEVGGMLTRLRRRKGRGAGETDTGQWNAPADVAAASECCAFFRVSALSKLGKDGKYLNERLPEGRTILDLSRRSRGLGMKMQVIPSSIVWHHRHQAPREGFFAVFYG